MRYGSSHIPFVRAASNDSVSALAEARIYASSASLNWPGVLVEAGTVEAWTVDDLTIEGHYLAMNLDERAVQFKVRTPLGWDPMSISPGAFWILPEGTPFTHRVRTAGHWIAAVIQPEFMHRVLGRHHRLRAGYGTQDHVLSSLMKAILHEVQSGGVTGAAFAEQLTRALVMALGLRHGAPDAELTGRGGLGPTRLAQLARWIEKNLGASLSVDLLAAKARLSPTHFAREFRRSTGETPWAYVVRMRLERARELLSSGERIGDVAQACGFADQAHMTRLFKQHFGLTPGALLKQLRHGLLKTDRLLQRR